MPGPLKKMDLMFRQRDASCETGRRGFQLHRIGLSRLSRFIGDSQDLPILGILDEIGTDLSGLETVPTKSVSFSGFPAFSD